jgi:hypothetical protein
VALFALGFYFGYAAYKSDSIFIPMILHFINNLLAVLAFLVLGSEEMMGTNVKHSSSLVPQLLTFAVSLFLFVSFMIFISKNYNKLTATRKDSL